MSGEKDLDALIAAMSPQMGPEVYVFSTVHPDTDLSLMEVMMMFKEAEGVTLILRRDDALAYGVGVEFPCRMITLTAHSSLAAVGFMARIAQALAARGISVNPVAGFYHDHLFVPEDRAEEAMEALRGLQAGT